MSRILKRPMFRRGGPINTGIMSGLVDRKNYQEDGFVTTVGQKASRLIPEFETLLEKYTPETRLGIGEFGLDIASGTPIIQALKTGYGKFTKADDARERAIQSGAVKLGISQAMTEAKPDKTSVLAAEKKARFLLPPNATAEQIRAKTAELIRSEQTGKTYSTQANLERAINAYRGQYGDGSKAFNHASFDVKVAPALRAAGKNPRSNIKFKDEDGKYKTKGKSPGVYIDVENGKVIEFDGNVAVELKEYSALLK